MMLREKDGIPTEKDTKTQKFLRPRWRRFYNLDKKEKLLKTLVNVLEYLRVKSVALSYDNADSEDNEW